MSDAAWASGENPSSEVAAMRFLLRGVVAFALVCVVSVSSQAREPKKEAKKDEKPDPLAQTIKNILKETKLDKAQEEKLEAVKKEVVAKYLLLAERESKIVTPERAKARAEARKKAMDDGKKGKELQ